MEGVIQLIISFNPAPESSVTEATISFRIAIPASATLPVRHYLRQELPRSLAFGIELNGQGGRLFRSNPVFGYQFCLFQHSLSGLLLFVWGIAVSSQDLLDLQTNFCLNAFPLCPVDCYALSYHLG